MGNVSKVFWYIYDRTEKDESRDTPPGSASSPFAEHIVHPLSSSIHICYSSKSLSSSPTQIEERSIHAPTQHPFKSNLIFTTLSPIYVYSILADKPINNDLQPQETRAFEGRPLWHPSCQIMTRCIRVLSHSLDGASTKQWYTWLHTSIMVLHSVLPSQLFWCINQYCSPINN